MISAPLPFTDADLMRAFREWLDSDLDDPRAMLNRLRLPGTRRRVLNTLRDRHLIAVAVLIAPGCSHYGRAIALQDACREFAGHLWPLWQRLSAPPDYGTSAAQALFWAFRFDCGERGGRPHGPAEWSLSQFRKLLPPLHDSIQKCA